MQVHNTGNSPADSTPVLHASKSLFAKPLPHVFAPQGRREQGRKNCDRCSKGEQDVLIRCSCKEWQGWKLVCGKCWKDVSGGVPDGDADHPDYRYGGLWRFRKGKAGDGDE